MEERGAERRSSGHQRVPKRRSTGQERVRDSRSTAMVSLEARLITMSYNRIQLLAATLLHPVESLVPSQ